jgi:hypothetical protein
VGIARIVRPALDHIRRPFGPVGYQHVEVVDEPDSHIVLRLARREGALARDVPPADRQALAESGARPLLCAGEGGQRVLFRAVLRERLPQPRRPRFDRGLGLLELTRPLREVLQLAKRARRFRRPRDSAGRATFDCVPRPMVPDEPSLICARARYESLRSMLFRLGPTGAGSDVGERLLNIYQLEA